MKKIALSMTALAVVLAVTFTSCKKDDTGAPVITLTGNGTIEVNLGDVYTDAGATATDDQDGDITPTATGTVNTEKVGSYTITYSAVDAAGNEAAEVVRTVNVKAEKLAKTYSVVESYTPTSPEVTYSQVVSVSVTGFDKLAFSAFGDYPAANIIATASASGLTAPEKTFQAPSTNPTHNARIYNFTGTYGKVGSLYNVLTVTYKIDMTPIAGGATETTTISQAYTVL
jgi:hypothetical protein